MFNTLAFRLIVTAIFLIVLSVNVAYYITRDEIHNIEIRTTAKILATKIQETLTIINNLPQSERPLIRRNLKRENIFYVTGNTPYFFPKVTPIVKNEDIRLGILEIIDNLQPFRVIVAGHSIVNNYLDLTPETDEENDNDELITMIVELSDGSFVWVGMNEAVYKAHSFIPIVVPLLIISIPLMIVILLTLFWVLRPLRLLTLAAKSIGTSFHQTPNLPKSNLHEIKVASQAMQDMHQSLKQQFDRLVITLGALSHDLRTPLQRLRLRAELLGDEKARENIHRDVEELQQRVEDGLYYLRLSSTAVNNSKTNINPHSSVENLVEKINLLVDDYKSSTKSPNTVEFIYDKNKNWHINCHWVSLARALGNVVDNGLTYGEKVVITLKEQKGFLVIEVRDFGKGIPPEKFNDALTPFVRLEESRTQTNSNYKSATASNSGLGLAIAKAIVQQHSGNLELANHPVGGLIVSLFLPKNL